MHPPLFTWTPQQCHERPSPTCDYTLQHTRTTANYQTHIHTHTLLSLFLQEAITRLQLYWSSRGCAIWLPHNTEVIALDFGRLLILLQEQEGWMALEIEQRTHSLLVPISGLHLIPDPFIRHWCQSIWWQLTPFVDREHELHWLKSPTSIFKCTLPSTATFCHHNRPPHSSSLHRVGQICIYTPDMTVQLVVSPAKNAVYIVCAFYI